jgi:hypothetical protein
LPIHESTIVQFPGGDIDSHIDKQFRNALNVPTMYPLRCTHYKEEHQMKKLFVTMMVLILSTAGMAVAAEDGGLVIGLEYRFRVDSLKGSVHDYSQFGIDPLTGNPTFTPVTGYDVKNDTVMMHRFGVNIRRTPSRTSP